MIVARRNYHNDKENEKGREKNIEENNNVINITLWYHYNITFNVIIEKKLSITWWRNHPLCINLIVSLLSAEYAQCNLGAISGQWVPPTHSPRALSFFSLGFFLGNGNCFGPGLQLPSDFNFCNFIIIFRYFVWPNTPSPFLINSTSCRELFSVYNFIFEPLSMS